MRMYTCDTRELGGIHFVSFGQIGNIGRRGSTSLCMSSENSTVEKLEKLTASAQRARKLIGALFFFRLTHSICRSKAFRNSKTCPSDPHFRPGRRVTRFGVLSEPNFDSNSGSPLQSLIGDWSFRAPH